jgi:hypothetical protein
MTVSSYDSTYETTPTTSEDSMFGAPIYARRPKRQDRNNKIFLGAAAAGVLIAAGAVFWATSAANDRGDTPEVATAEPVAAAPMRPIEARPVATPVTPAVEPVLRAAPTPVRTTPTPRAAPAPRTRVAASAPSAPSATDSGSNVSTREYAPVTAAPPAPIEPTPAPVTASEPPASTPVLIIPE